MKHSTKFTIITVLVVVLLGLVTAYAYNRHLTNLANREEVARQKAINIYLRRDSSILDYQLKSGQKIRSVDENYYNAKSNGRLKEMDNHGIVPYVEQALQDTKDGGTFEIQEEVHEYIGLDQETVNKMDKQTVAKKIIQKTFDDMEESDDKVSKEVRSYLLGEAKDGQSFESFTAKQLDQLGEVLEHLPIKAEGVAASAGSEEFIYYLDRKYK